MQQVRPPDLHRAGSALVFAAVLVLTMGSAETASAQAFSDFAIGTANATPFGIAVGPDGNLWFTESLGNKIGRITTAGVITEFTIPTANSHPLGIAAGPDGALWFTENATNKIGRITTAGAISEFALIGSHDLGAIAAGSDGALWFTEGIQSKIGRIAVNGAITEFNDPAFGSPRGITAGTDGALWFTEDDSNLIGRIDPKMVQAGTTAGITEFVVPTANSRPFGIVGGPDGALWFTELASNKIGRSTTTGMITNEFAIPTSNSQPTAIAVGPDGALWFTEFNTDKLGRVSTSGAVTEFSIPTVNNGGLNGIVSGPDGALWFTEVSSNRIGRLAPGPAASRLVAAILPESRSIEVGATATAFATMINADTGTAISCGLVPISSVPATFLFQTTDPNTNALTGSPNTRVNIPAGKSQSFVIAFTANAAFAPTDVAIGFDCAGSDAAPIFIGLNTLLLSGSASPVPDIVALAASSDPGIVDIPGNTGTGAFAVATVNVGASASISATADTGAASLPLTAQICQTNPGTGACMTATGPSVTTTINANATPTFAIFVTGSGAVPFSPAANRIFVRFKDAGGVTRGSTSVAVRTQ